MSLASPTIIADLALGADTASTEYAEAESAMGPIFDPAPPEAFDDPDATLPTHDRGDPGPEPGATTTNDLTPEDAGETSHESGKRGSPESAGVQAPQEDREEGGQVMVLSLGRGGLPLGRPPGEPVRMKAEEAKPSRRVGSGRKGHSSSPKARSTAPEVESPSLEELFRDIQNRQEMLANLEGDGIEHLVRIGVVLHRLKGASGRSWGERLKTLGYSPRVATRLMKVGKAWDPENRHQASELFPRLTNDLNKLEWLCRLSFEQLHALLDLIDVRKATRGAVVARVREILQLAPSPRAGTDKGLVGSIEKTFDRLGVALDRIKGECLAPEQAARAREAMEAGISRLQAGLVRSDDEGGTPS